MTTIKKGSKGQEVLELQKLLNKAGYKVAEDSDFGPATDSAVRAFQKAKGLEPDGIVGSKTWTALGRADGVAGGTKAVDPSVVYLPLKACLTKAPGRKIKYLIIHYTAGSSSAAGSAKSMKGYWEQKREASADFGVDDGGAVQFNPDPSTYYCWSVSGGNGIYNSNSISIEICSNRKPGTNKSKPNHEGWYFTEASLDNAVKLAKILMKKFNIPIDRVVRHWDSTKKVCPGIPNWVPARLYDTKGNKTNKFGNESEWLKFKQRLL